MCVINEIFKTINNFITNKEKIDSWLYLTQLIHQVTKNMLKNVFLVMILYSVLINILMKEQSNLILLLKDIKTHLNSKFKYKQIQLSQLLLTISCRYKVK